MRPKSLIIIFLILLTAAILELMPFFSNFKNVYLVFDIASAFLILGFELELFLSLLILIAFYSWFNSIVALFSLFSIFLILSKILLKINILSLIFSSVSSSLIFNLFLYLLSNIFKFFGFTSKAIPVSYFFVDYFNILFLNPLIVIGFYYLCRLVISMRDQAA